MKSLTSSSISHSISYFYPSHIFFTSSSQSYNFSPSWPTTRQFNITLSYQCKKYSVNYFLEKKNEHITIRNLRHFNNLYFQQILLSQFSIVIWYMLSKNLPQPNPYSTSSLPCICVCQDSLYASRSYRTLRSSYVL